MRKRIPVSTRRRRRQKGNTLLELAICFTSFLMLTFGALDFGLAVYSYNFCYYAARDASRYASVHGAGSATASDCSASPGIAGGCAANSSDISSFVSKMAIALDSTKLTTTTTWTPDTSAGSEVNVKVAYTYSPVSALALSNSITFSSSSQMEIVH